MTTPASKSRDPQACVNGCLNPKTKKPAGLSLAKQTETQKTFTCDVCGMEHSVGLSRKGK